MAHGQLPAETFFCFQTAQHSRHLVVGTHDPLQMPEIVQMHRTEYHHRGGQGLAACQMII